MTFREFINEVTAELGCVIDSSQFRRDQFLIKRPSRNPSYVTEYVGVEKGDFGNGLRIWLQGNTNKILAVDLADPDSLNLLCQYLEDPTLWLGSHKDFSTPLANCVFQQDEFI